MSEQHFDWERRARKAEGLISHLKELSGAKSISQIKRHLIDQSPSRNTTDDGLFDPTEPIDDITPTQQPKTNEGTVTAAEAQFLGQGFNVEDLEMAKRLGGGSVAKALKDPTAMAALRGIREQRAVQNMIPEPTSRVPTHREQPFLKRSENEKKTGYVQEVEKLINKGRGPRRGNIGR